jgi:hypothetical protein
MVFLLFVILLKTSFQRITQSKKPPCGGSCFLLDRGAGGSRTRVQHNGHMLSTCLVLLDCREKPAAEQPNFNLVPVFSSSDRNNLQTSPVLRAPPYRVGSGHYRPGDVSSQHMCREIPPKREYLSYCYSLKRRERN